MIYFVVCSVLLFSLSAVNAAAITNGQLFDLLQEQQQDVKEYSNSDGDDVMDVKDDDIIDLAGEEDDEVDIGYLMDKLGLLNGNDADVSSRDDPLVGGCTCHKDSCTCCVGKLFTLRLGTKTIKAVIHGCVTVKYVPSKTQFLLTFVLNGHQLYHKVASLVVPPKVCGKITGSLTTAIVCLNIYNVNVSNKSLCTRLLGLIDFKVGSLSRKVYFRIGIGCFKIPVMSHDWLTEMRLSAKEVTSDEDKIVSSN